MPVIAIEGLHGVGKTTTAVKLAAKLGGAFFGAVEFPDESNTHELDSDFNRLLVQEHARILTARNRGPEAVSILDGGIYGIVATYSELGSGMAQRYEVEAALAPDVAIYLWTAEGVRRRRLSGAGQVPTQPIERSLALRDEYESFGLPAVETLRPSDAVVDSVAYQILESGKVPRL